MAPDGWSEKDLGVGMSEHGMTLRCLACGRLGYAYAFRDCWLRFPNDWCVRLSGDGTLTEAACSEKCLRESGGEGKEEYEPVADWSGEAYVKREREECRERPCCESAKKRRGLGERELCPCPCHAGV